MTFFSLLRKHSISFSKFENLNVFTGYYENGILLFLACSIYISNTELNQGSDFDPIMEIEVGVMEELEYPKNLRSSERIKSQNKGAP